jgi:hypothetical protein
MVDGDAGDWNLGAYGVKVRGGSDGQGLGDIAVHGFDMDDGTGPYYSSIYGPTNPPTDPADHAVKLYAQDNAQYQYFLLQVHDQALCQPAPAVWGHDNVEIYIDPDHGQGPGSGEGTGHWVGPGGDSQIVINYLGEAGVFMVDPGHSGTETDRRLAGVSTGAAPIPGGWQLEVGLDKAVLGLPAYMSSDTVVGIDFNFWDPDTDTPWPDWPNYTIYSWADNTTPSGCPSKVPDNWGILMPEPATLALLALGGLFGLRRRRV